MNIVSHIFFGVMKQLSYQLGGAQNCHGKTIWEIGIHRIGLTYETTMGKWKTNHEVWKTGLCLWGLLPNFI